MSYSDFTLAELKSRFGLRLDESSNHFAAVEPIPVGQALHETLREGVPLALAINTEKARSELIIAPVLMEVRRQCPRPISLFSGSDFTVDPDQGLRGPCDFLISLSKEQLAIEAPVVAVAEAKKEDINRGIMQCTAEMVAARLFNQQRGNDIPIVYGVVSSGNIWKFLSLEGSAVHVERSEYYINPVERIVGIMLHMLRSAAGQ